MAQYVKCHAQITMPGDLQFLICLIYGPPRANWRAQVRVYMCTRWKIASANIATDRPNKIVVNSIDTPTDEFLKYTCKYGWKQVYKRSTDLPANDLLKARRLKMCLNGSSLIKLDCVKLQLVFHWSRQDVKCYVHYMQIH